jgi:hypothetical protein
LSNQGPTAARPQDGILDAGSRRDMEVADARHRIVGDGLERRRGMKK